MSSSKDLLGMFFGELKVVDKKENHSLKNNRVFTRWICKCSCGNIIEVTASQLKTGHVKSCGCLKNKKEDLSGTTIERLTFLYPDKNNVGKWICKCECGNLTSVFSSNVKRGLTKSCGCLHSELISQKLTKDLIGQKFGRLLVIKRDNGVKKSNGVYWQCRCDCGNYVSVISHSLTNGNTKSCGCLKSESSSQRFSHNLTGQIFGKLKVLCRDGTFIGADKTKYSQWLCQCECGTTKIVRGHDLVRGSVTSCGCIVSRGEEKIRIVLNQMHVKFQTQYTFDDLRSKKGGLLKFDFAIIDNKMNLMCLIEYQGQQHYDDSYGWFGEQQRSETDGLKREYCQIHNIPLFEIKFDEDIENSINNILSKFKINKSIPC